MSPWFPKIVFLVFIVLTRLIRLPYKRMRKKQSISLRDVSGTEKWVFIAAFSGMMLLPLMYILTPWLAELDYSLPFGVQLAGVLLLIPALWLFYRSHADLGKNWSPALELRKGHELVSNGVYARVRHPMYTAIWLWVLAQPLLLTNWIAGWSGILGFGLLYFLRIKREEDLMHRQFGEAYERYCQRTGRLWPRLKSSS